MIYQNSLFTCERSKNIINNLLNEICTKTDIPIEQYEDWLTQEVGMKQEEINELKSDCLFPEPSISIQDLEH